MFYTPGFTNQNMSDFSPEHEFSPENQAIQVMPGFSYLLSRDDFFPPQENAQPKELWINVVGKAFCQIIPLKRKNNGLLDFIIRFPDGTEYILINGFSFHSQDDSKFAVHTEVQGIRITVPADGKEIEYCVVDQSSKSISPESHVIYQQTPCGKDGVLEGAIDDCPVYLASHGALGPYRYSVNEDSGGFNPETKMIIVADGVGGYLQSQFAANLAVKSLLEFVGKDIHSAVNYAHARLGELNTLLGNYNAAPDATLAGVQLDGNKMNSVILGDARVYVIRNGKIVFRTRERSVIAEKLAVEIFKKPLISLSLQELEELDHHIQSSQDEGVNSITTALGRQAYYYPDFYSFNLEEDDYVVLLTDGAILPDEVLIQAIGNHSVSDGVENAVAYVKRRNVNGGYQTSYEGINFKHRAHYDNATIAVYRHRKNNQAASPV